MAFLLKSKTFYSILIGGFATVLLASFLPIWHIFYLNPYEGLGESRTLWILAFEVFESRQTPPDPNFPVTVTAGPENLIILAFVFGVGCFLGAAIHVTVRFFRSKRR